MYDFLIDIASTLWKHGFTVTTAGTFVFLLLKTAAMKRRLKKVFPWLFDNESEVKPYIENQKIIMENQKLIMERMGIECVPTSATCLEVEKSHRLKVKGQSQWLLIMQSTVRFAKKFTKFGGKKMKNYLRKLGSRKFQSLLLSLIVNAVTAYLFLTGTVEIDAAINSYMPMINLIVGTISTWLYIWVEGKIDASHQSPSAPQNEQIDYTQDTGA